MALPLWKVVVSEPLTPLATQWYATTYIVRAKFEDQATRLAVNGHHALYADRGLMSRHGEIYTRTTREFASVVVCGPAIPIDPPGGRWPGQPYEPGEPYEPDVPYTDTAATPRVDTEA